MNATVKHKCLKVIWVNIPEAGFLKQEITKTFENSNIFINHLSNRFYIYKKPTLYNDYML